MYDLNDIYQGICYLVFLGLAFLLLYQGKYSLKQFAVYVCVGCLLLLSIFYLRDAYLLVLLCFILNGANINLNDLVKFDLKIRIFLIAFIVSLSLMGVIDNYSAVINGVYKQALGFSHPNVLAAMVFVALIEWIYLRFYRLKWYDVVGMLVCCYIISQISAGRSSLYSFYIVFLLAIVLKIFPKILNSKVFKYLCSSLTVICTVICFWLVKLYELGNSYALILNEILTRRLLQAYRLLDAYGVSVIGQQVSTHGTRNSASSSAEYFSVDMSYIYIPIKYGVIILVLLCIGYFFYTKKVIEEKNVPLLISIIFFIVLGLTESYFYRVSYNYTLVAILSYLSIINHGRDGTNLD
ncbi:MAG: hypothetical protein LIO79_05140 [Rikenellaceae bacterium]|nr:hypothetical protein [Rikenellaceae bacterium]